jgi:hypothetical protein
LDVPDVSAISRYLATLESCGNGIFIADGSTSSVDDPGAFLEVLQEIGVNKTPSALVEWAVDRDDIALICHYYCRGNGESEEIDVLERQVPSNPRPFSLQP